MDWLIAGQRQVLWFSPGLCRLLLQIDWRVHLLIWSLKLAILSPLHIGLISLLELLLLSLFPPLAVDAEYDGSNDGEWRRDEDQNDKPELVIDWIFAAIISCALS